jgi:hypothetical protein
MPAQPTSVLITRLMAALVFVMLQKKVGTAADAKDQGKCVRLRHFNYVSGFIFPVIEPC